MAKKQATETPLYVRLPSIVGNKLDRASEALGIPKKDLVAGLVTKYVDPDSERGLNALGTLSQPRRIGATSADASPAMGSYSFQPYNLAEVMDVEQAAQLLLVDEPLVVEMAEAGKLPGRKLGSFWRFSRSALVAWLSNSERAL